MLRRRCSRGGEPSRRTGIGSAVPPCGRDPPPQDDRSIGIPLGRRRLLRSALPRGHRGRRRGADACRASPTVASSRRSTSASRTSSSPRSSPTIATPADTPSAWVPLFAQRSRRGVAPLQFALAGMNAHINRDLPVALVTTCRELGLDLRDGSREHCRLRTGGRAARPGRSPREALVSDRLASLGRPARPPLAAHRRRRGDVGRRTGRATRPGRTRRRCGRSAASRRWQTTTCSRSTAWSASRVAGSSSPRTPGCSGSAARCRARGRLGHRLARELVHLVLRALRDRVAVADADDGGV